MSSSELSTELGYSPRTIQRDMAALESELGVPLTFENRKYGIMEGSHPLSPVRFTLQEARAVYVAGRLFARATDERDPDAITALDKIADTLPPAMARNARNSIDDIRARPPNDDQIAVVRTLTEAWAGSLMVTIAYCSNRSNEPYLTDLAPYLMEPSPSGAAMYVAGLSSRHGEVRMFKIDRIASATLTGERFDPGDTRELSRQLARSWGGIVFGDDQYDVAVDFAPAVARRIAETRWHYSQQLEPLGDGGVRLRVVLPSLLEFVPWVLSWGPNARVHGPQELRDQVAAELRSAAARYDGPAR